MRTKSQNEQKSQTPQEFAKDHWKEVAPVAVTLAGGIIYLLIKYHKKRNKENGDTENEQYLDTLADDALLSDRHPTPLIFDLMADVNEIIPDAEQLTAKMSKGLPKKVKGKKSKKRWFKGSPRQIMKSIGKVK